MSRLVDKIVADVTVQTVHAVKLWAGETVGVVAPLVAVFSVHVVGETLWATFIFVKHHEAVRRAGHAAVTSVPGTSRTPHVVAVLRAVVSTLAVRTRFEACSIWKSQIISIITLIAEIISKPPVASERGIRYS